MKHSVKDLGETGGGSGASQRDVSDYVAGMALELRTLCKNNDLSYLAYLLEIVFIEASEQSLRGTSDQGPSSGK